MLLDYFTYDCLDHILIHYSLCNVAKYFVSLEKTAESESLASYIVQWWSKSAGKKLRTKWK